MTAVADREARVGFPGDPSYQAATQVFNLSAPAQPAAAVTARTVAQVRGAIRYADANQLALRVHATGHSSAAVRPMRDALLIRTELVGEVRIDARRRTAWVPAGTRWGAVIEAAAAHGLAAPHGSSPTVGVVGYLLRGGVSYYGRQVGLAVNSLRAVELVTPDGELRCVDHTTDPQLYWALRGGGGGFGVVTAVEFDLFPATIVYTGAAFWPGTHAAALLRAWLQWTREAPAAATTSLRVMNLPDLPEIPRALVGGPVVGVDGVVLGTAGDDATAVRRHAKDLLGPLRATSPPVFDTWQLTTPLAVPESHMDPADPVPVIGDHLLLDELGEAGAAEFLRVVGEGSGSPLVSAELRQLGKAFAVPQPAGGALDHFAARFAYMGAGVPTIRGTPESIRAHCATVRTVLSPWDTGWTAPTFVESPEQPQRHLDPAAVAAVDQVRARVDPAGRFQGDVAPTMAG